MNGKGYSGLYRKLGMSCFLGGMFALIGCGLSYGSVSGKVVHKGQPLKGGYVTFISNEGKPSASAEILLDGTYTVPKIATGAYKVTVDTSMLKGASGMAGPGGSGPPGGMMMPKGAPPKSEPPAKSKNEIAEQLAKTGYKQGSTQGPAGDDLAKRYTKIPDKYKDAEQSGLTFTVTGNGNTFDITVD